MTIWGAILTENNQDTGRNYSTTKAVRKDPNGVWWEAWRSDLVRTHTPNRGHGRGQKYYGLRYPDILPCEWEVWVTFSFQLVSHVWPCDPIDCGTPGLPVHHQLPELTETHVHWVCSSTISSSVDPFSSRLQSFPASGSFPMSWLYVVNYIVCVCIYVCFSVCTYVSVNDTWYC